MADAPPPNQETSPAEGVPPTEPPSPAIEPPVALSVVTDRIRDWIARRSARDIWIGFAGGVLSGLVLWWIQGAITSAQSDAENARLVTAIERSVTNECQRLQATFATLYDSYPTMECGMNIYRLPQPDVALTSYLNDRRELIIDAMGDDGASLIRDSALASEAYQRFYTDPYFDAVISEHTSTFQSYYEPLVRMCSKVGVEISIQACPY